jgi:hypothetical protein
VLDEEATHLKDMTLATDDEPGRRLLVPLLGTTHVALAPRSHWVILLISLTRGVSGMKHVPVYELRMLAGPDAHATAGSSPQILLPTSTLILSARPGA